MQVIDGERGTGDRFDMENRGVGRLKNGLRLLRRVANLGSEDERRNEQES
jgi:hypothetical protein